MSVVAVFMMGMTLLYPLAMFRGLEPTSGYFGNAYQALHPDSFPDDPFMSPARPTMHSLVYLLVKLVGERWLDDRVTFVVFMGLTAAALLGIDRTARLLGATRAGERIAILSLMLLGHQILNNRGFAVDCIDFSPTVFAAPVIIWLLHASLAGSAPRRVIPLMALVPLISLKSAAMPLLLAGTLLWKDRLGARGRRIAGLAALGLVAASLAVYYAFVRPPDGSHPWVFDHLVREDPSEADPFKNPPMGSALFLAMCAAGLVMRGPNPAAMERVKVVAGLGGLVWLLGGLYVSLAPDGLKIPYLAAAHPPRMLWWTQYVLYLALGVGLLKGVQQARSWAGLGAAWGVLMALYLLHDTFHAKLAVVVIGMSVVMTGVALRRLSGSGAQSPQPSARSQGIVVAMRPAWRLRAVSVAMAVGVLSLYGIGTLHRRLDALRSLVRHGVMGDNETAKWVGVNEYVRSSTPASATFLALSVARDGRTLMHDGFLRVRTGRSMLFGHPVGLYFDARSLRWYDEQLGRINALLSAWDRRQPDEVSRALSDLGAPDYVVAPTGRSEWLREHPEFPYAADTAIGHFTVLRKGSPG